MHTSTEFRSSISAPTIKKGRLLFIVLRPNVVQITLCFLSLSLVTPRHRCVIVHAAASYKDRFYRYHNSLRFAKTYSRLLFKAFFPIRELLRSFASGSLTAAAIIAPIWRGNMLGFYLFREQQQQSLFTLFRYRR